MANTATNVTTGKPKVGGAVYWAPIGTTLPADATTALASTYTCLGYVSEDGVTNDNSPASEVLKAWGGDTVLNMQTERPDSFGLTLIEALNEDVLKAIYGEDNVIEPTTGKPLTVLATPDDMTPGVWVFDMILRGGVPKRIVVPNGVISNLGTISYKDDAAVGYAITVNDIPVYDSARAKSVYHYEYIGANGT